MLHHPHRLAIALGPRVAEVAVDLLLGVAALLMADDQDRLAFEAREPAHDRPIVGKSPIAMQFGEFGAQAFDVVEHVRPVRVARHRARAARE